MTSFRPNQSVIENALKLALRDTGLFVVDEVVKVTPRDLDRLPRSIDRQDGKPPRRSTAFKPVMINGSWYPWVSGALKRSIMSQVVGSEVRVGVAVGPATKYAKHLEFGTRHMAPRSYLRKTIEEKKTQIMSVLKKSFISALWRS